MTCRIVNSRPSLGKGNKRVEKKWNCFSGKFSIHKKFIFIQKNFSQISIKTTILKMKFQLESFCFLSDWTSKVLYSWTYKVKRVVKDCFYFLEFKILRYELDKCLSLDKAWFTIIRIEEIIEITFMFCIHAIHTIYILLLTFGFCWNFALTYKLTVFLHAVNILTTMLIDHNLLNFLIFTNINFYFVYWCKIMTIFSKSLLLF